jgi:hypothetical protein
MEGVAKRTQPQDAGRQGPALHCLDPAAHILHVAQADTVGYTKQ